MAYQSSAHKYLILLKEISSIKRGPEEFAGVNRKNLLRNQPLTRLFVNPMKFLPFLLSIPSLAAAAGPSLTIYNQNFAVVRETVPLELKQGVNEVRFNGISGLLEPESVVLRDPAGKVDLQILEQNFRNDPVSQHLMLSRFEGKEIDFLIREAEKPDRTVKGKVIRSGYVSPYARANGGTPLSEPLIEVEGQLRFSLPGIPLFPALADDAILKPELGWKLNSSKATTLNAELGYITGGMSWSADYNAVASENSDTLDITGWVTMNNRSGKIYNEASIKLMAGDVSKISPERKDMEGFAMARAKNTSMSAPQVTEKSFDEYHLYTLPNPVTLRDNETKQVEFLRAQGIPSSRVYVYDGAALSAPQWQGHDPVYLRQNPEYGTESNPKVWVMREFKNSKENHLGIPLPKGKLRFYQRDTDGSLQFVGENEIDHTPKDETVRVYVGNAFDIVGERKRTDFRVDSANNSADESFEITLRNRKKDAVEVRVVEKLYRWVNWEIKTSSLPFTKLDAQKIEFRVPLKPDEVKTISYKVHYSW
jgi:hypothetical protein